MQTNRLLLIQDASPTSALPASDTSSDAQGNLFAPGHKLLGLKIGGLVYGFLCLACVGVNLTPLLTQRRRDAETQRKPVDLKIAEITLNIHDRSIPHTLRQLDNRNILILTAVQMEARALRRVVAQFGCRLHTVGIEAKHLPSSSQLVDVSCMILCGLAGALDPSLKVGDVVLDDAQRFTVPLRRGKIHTASQIISTPQNKRECFAETGAMAVDMEQAKLQPLADQYQIPLIGLRAISDTANQTLNPKVVHFIDDLGKPKALSIAWGLMRQPNLIPYLRLLNADSKYALLQLADALTSILISIEQGK